MFNGTCDTSNRTDVEDELKNQIRFANITIHSRKRNVSVHPFKTIILQFGLREMTTSALQPWNYLLESYSNFKPSTSSDITSMLRCATSFTLLLSPTKIMAQSAKT